MKIRELKFTNLTPEKFWKNLKDQNVSVITAHAEMIYMASQDNNYLKPIKQADILVADGVGLKKGLEFLGVKVSKCSGVDLIESLVKESNDVPTFLWGGKSEIVGQAAVKYIGRGLNIVGFFDGYNRDDEKIFQKIKESKARLVLVGMGGTERQLILVNKIKNELGVSAITVGGAFDVAAGKFKRAPKMFQKSGLEWLWRMLQDPKRIKRLPHLFGFVFLVLNERLFNEK